MFNLSKKPIMINLVSLIKKPLEWLAERRAERDTDIYLRLYKDYTPDQAQRLWMEIKKRRKKKWYKF